MKLKKKETIFRSFTLILGYSDLVKLQIPPSTFYVLEFTRVIVTMTLSEGSSSLCKDV